MLTDKYSRQEIIGGWNQEKLAKTSVCLAGDGILADFILADLLAMGIGKITRIGTGRLFKFEKMRGDAELEQIDVKLINHGIAEVYMPEADFVIEAGNDAVQKYAALKHAEENGMPFISASSTEESFMLSCDTTAEKSAEFHLGTYDGREQGRLNSIICSAMATDELRKRLFSLEYDLKTGNFFHSAVKEHGRTLEGKKLALVGAGASGTFAGLGLAFEDAEADVIDFDTVEESNLSRQVLFYDAIGKSKAKTLAERLNSFGGGFNGIAEKVDLNFNAEGYDAILSCVDNFSSRRVLNQLAEKYGIPLVNCGVSVYEGEANGYIPGKTACLDCQMHGALSREDSNKKTGCLVQPSLIMPNQIAGALIVEELYRTFRGEPAIIRFGSGEGISYHAPEIKCLETCLKNAGRT